MESNRIRTARVLYPNVEDAFQDLFGEELDSWHCADHVLCSACYDDFAATWPGIVGSDSFQRRYMDLETFYSGSVLQQLYDAETYKRLCQRILCERCGKSVGSDFWAYTPPKFEEEITAIADIAAKTPFLVLRHPLAQRVLTLIEKLGEITTPVSIIEPYFRARRYNGLASQAPSEFLPQVPALVTEGRYNHNGQPVLYLGSDEETCYRELSRPEVGVCIAKISLTRKVALLDLCCIDGSAGPEEQEVLETLIVSSLMTAPVSNAGWCRPEYVFTRFVADCARVAGFDGIKYPSSRWQRGHNLVILCPGDSWDHTVSASPGHHYNAGPTA